MSNRFNFSAVFILLIAALPVFGQGPYYRWAHSMGSALTAVQESGNDIAADAAGNVYVIGNFYGPTDFDTSEIDSILTSAGESDIFLAKYDPDGSYLWAFSIGGIGIEEGAALAIDAVGNVVITGAFRNSIDIDPSAATVSLTTNAAQDAFVAKYSPEGELLWGFKLGSINGLDEGTDVTVDSNDDVYVTGWFNNTIDFNPAAGVVNTTSAGFSDIYLAKYSSAGAYQWVARFGGTGGEFPFALTCDNADNVYVTGDFQNTVDFDPSAATANVTAAAGISDAFIVKLTGAGVYQWAHGFGNTQEDHGYGLITDSDNNVYMLGAFSLAVDFDPSPAVASFTAVGDDDVFVAKYSSTGAYVHTITFGGVFGFGNNGLAIARGEGESYYVTGIFYETEDFDPSPGVFGLTAGAGGSDIFVAHYTNEGVLLEVSAINGPSVTFASSIFVNNKDLYLAGFFYESIDPDPSDASDNLISVGSGDIFFGKYLTCAPLIVVNQPQSYYGCPGEVDFEVEVQGEATYQWFKDGEAIETDGTSSILHIADASESAQGDYYVEITGCDFVTSQTVSLNLIPPAFIVSENFTESVCQSQSAVMFVEVSGNGEYQWFKNGQAIENETESSLIINTASAEDEGFYHVEFTSECGNGFLSNSAEVEVVDTVKIIVQPQDITVFIGDEINLDAEASGEHISYQWRKGEDVIQGGGLNVNIPEALVEDAGEYTLVASNECNQDVSRIALVQVLVPVGNEEEVANRISYTNPFSNQLRFSFGEDSGQSSVSIYSAQGSLVYRAEVDRAQVMEVNSSQWPQGFYYFVGTRGKQMVRVKLVKEQ